MPINKEEYAIGDLFRKIIKSELAKVHTSIPAKIVKINSDNTVDVVPVIKDKNLLNELVTLPIIAQIPVRFFRTSIALISIPLTVGDYGTIIFYERNIKNWQLAGNIQEPEDNRRFNLSDCSFCPDILPDGQGITLDNNLNIILNNSKIIIYPNGNISLENSNGTINIDSAGNVILNGISIKLGTTATEKAVKGDTLETLINAFIGIYNSHSHAALGAPPSASATPLDGSELSTKVKVE